MQSFRLALSFLTIAPSGITTQLDDNAFGRSVKYFALVGLCIGLLLAGADAILLPRLAALASSVVIVVSLIGITRALHLDGLADTFDGLFGGRDKEHMLTIMKDSRVGSFGVIAIVAMLALKIVLLASLNADVRLATIITFPLLGRLATSYAITTQPYARSTGGLGAMFIGGSSKSGLAVAGVISFATVMVLLQAAGIAVLAAMAAFVLIYIWWVKRKIGGMTGDTLGALIELTEVMVLFIMALV